ncbi:MAG: hypothetical protein QOG08_1394 [Chloroflexota bacterium]|nr:hypothetical protein [Chloroflexota bacterium]
MDVRKIGRGLRFGKDLADRPPHAANDSVHQLRVKRANRASSQEISIDRRDLLAENDAVVAQAARARRQGHTCRAQVAGREDWNHDQVVAHPVPDVFRQDYSRAGLMRIVRLARCKHVPDLSSARGLSRRPAWLAQVLDSRRVAADLRIARHPVCSDSIASSGCAYWASIAICCCRPYHWCSA